MLQCPWCGHWRHVETYGTLGHPTIAPKQCVPIYKCSGEKGCKMLFALRS